MSTMVKQNFIYQREGMNTEYKEAYKQIILRSATNPKADDGEALAQLSVQLGIPTATVAEHLDTMAEFVRCGLKVASEQGIRDELKELSNTRRKLESLPQGNDAERIYRRDQITVANKKISCQQGLLSQSQYANQRLIELKENNRFLADASKDM